MKVWMDGRIVDGRDARVSILDHGFLYGDGIFESLRVRGGTIFGLDAHLARLAASGRAIGLVLPLGPEDIGKIVAETVRARGEEDAYVRLLVTRGVGDLGVDPTSCPRPSVLCIATELRIHSDEKLARGLALVTASYRRAPADALDPRVKSMNYLTSALAKLEARRQGADEALLLNGRGDVAEASVANVFARAGEVLLTPPTSDGALPGITRATVLELAPRLGMGAQERSLGRVDLFRADEVFLTGTGIGIIGVRELDGQPVGGGAPGPATARIRAAYEELARSSGTPVWEGAGRRASAKLSRGPSRTTRRPSNG
jgi:branched-chain amino acid aminotransferase